MFKDRLPLTQQILDCLLERIKNGMYEDLFGGRLPSEQELAKEFGVSRTTIRDVITQLNTDGIVIKRPGVGTFVNKPPHGALRGWPYEKSSFLQLIRRTGHEPTVTVLNCGVRHENHWAKYFDMDKEEPVFAMEKIHFSDSIPVIHSWNVLPMALIQEDHLEVVKHRYPCNESVYTFLKEKCNKEVAYHDSDIRAAKSPANLCEVLNISEHTPILKLEELAYDQNSKVLFYGISYLRSDKVSFHIRRGLSLEI